MRKENKYTFEQLMTIAMQDFDHKKSDGIKALHHQNFEEIRFLWSDFIW